MDTEGSGTDRHISTQEPSDFHTSADLNAAASVAAALGNTVRVQIWCNVIPFREHGLSAGTLSKQLNVAPSSLSFHLQQMTRAGVLIARHDGRSIFYSVNRNSVAGLCDLLLEIAR